MSNASFKLGQSLKPKQVTEIYVDHNEIYINEEMEMIDEPIFVILNPQRFNSTYTSFETEKYIYVWKELL